MRVMGMGCKWRYKRIVPIIVVTVLSYGRGDMGGFTLHDTYFDQIYSKGFSLSPSYILDLVAPMPMTLTAWLLPEPDTTPEEGHPDHKPILGLWVRTSLLGRSRVLRTILVPIIYFNRGIIPRSRNECTTHFFHVVFMIIR